MHSSRMRSTRLFLVSPSMHCSGGVYLPWRGCTWSGGGVPGPGEVYLVLGGVPCSGGCTWSQGVYLILGGVPGPGGCASGDDHQKSLAGVKTGGSHA